jgi:serine/threonine protein kinase/tetratricopeptide (TPR) repeat protein
MTDDQRQDVFQGTSRFKIRSKLGSGASGSVYEVYDRERESAVALKVLNKINPAAIYRFKKEFRALADVAHANLVQLYELLSEGDSWFYTMELITGTDFLSYVRRDPGSQPHLDDGYRTHAQTMDVDQLAVDNGNHGDGVAATAREADLPFHEGRLRSAMRQLADGLVALHESNKLHRDLKPSNVLVTDEGRVVLLDLGLVRDMLPQRMIYESIDEDIVGTPAYMSPEQATGLQITQASDWYAVGAMLYQALTGKIPYTGNVLKILTDKQSFDPKPPREVCRAIPSDLDALCRALLRRDPNRRPSGREILRILGATEYATDPVHASTGISSGGTRIFVGRKSLLERLQESYLTASRGETITILMHGSSGIGKSALMRRFLDDLYHSNEETVILAGRCHVRESVPYKAFDALIDSLSRYLRSLPEDEAVRLLPSNVLALSRLFPVLNRVSAVAGARRRVLEIPDSRELRRRAFAALRELFQRLTDIHPVVLYIDDLQWGDVDSMELLSELLRPPDPPPLLLVTCFRSEDAMSSPLLRSLLSSGLKKAATEVRELVLDELSQEQSLELARQLLGSKVPGADELSQTIARESGGNPFLLETLARHIHSLASSGDAGPDARENLRLSLTETTMEKVVASQLGDLSDEARRLVEIIAVAGAPVEIDAARRAAEIEGNVHAPLTALRSARLIRLRGSRAQDRIEIYQNRVREGLLHLMDADKIKTLHYRLALALQASGNADPEALALYFKEAGELERAAEFAARAAQRASEALAFDRAARLNRIALEFPFRKEGDYRELQTRLGTALENAGRGAEAAEAFLAAAEGAKAGDALELRRRAAEQLLISGHLDQGIETVRQVLESIGMKLARTPMRALIGMLFYNLLLKLRGIKFNEMDSTQIPLEQLIRIDTCWSVSIGLGIADTIRGMEFGKRHVLLALKAGEPYRVARALAIEVGYSATGGSKTLERTRQLIRAATRLAKRTNHPHALGLVNMTSGMAAYLEGRWSRALERLAQAEEILRERCTGVTWEIDTSVLFQFRSLLLLGSYGEICRRLPSLLKDCRDRGDLSAETSLRTRVSWVVNLINDEPEEARAEVSSAIQRWTQQGFHLQHYWHLTGQTEISMYQGRALAGWDELEQLWTGLARSLLLKIQFTRTEALHLRARCALAAAVETGVDTPRYQGLVKVVNSCLKTIEKEKLRWADPLALLIRAGMLAAEGQAEEAADLLIDAIDGFEAADMALYAMAAQRCRGLLIGGHSGTELVQQAHAWMTEQQIKSPERITAVLAPGGWS